MRRIGILALIGLGAIVVFYPFSPAFRVKKELNKARHYAALISEQLGRNPRYMQVKAIPNAYSDEGVGIEMFGRAYSGTDLEGIRRIVKEIDPTVKVWWSIASPSGTWADVEIPYTNSISP